MWDRGRQRTAVLDDRFLPVLLRPIATGVDERFELPVRHLEAVHPVVRQRQCRSQESLACTRTVPSGAEAIGTSEYFKFWEPGVPSKGGYPSFTTLIRTAPNGTRTSSIGVRPRGVHSTFIAEYPFTQTSAPGGSLSILFNGKVRFNQTCLICRSSGSRGTTLRAAR